MSKRCFRNASKMCSSLKLNSRRPGKIVVDLTVINESYSGVINYVFKMKVKEELYESSEGEAENDDKKSDGDDVIDVEDLGTMMGKMNDAKKGKVSSEPKEMITPLLRKSLTKQGTNVIVCTGFSKPG